MTHSSIEDDFANYQDVYGPLHEHSFLSERIWALQPDKGLRAGIDSLFLGAAVQASDGQRVLEAGIGTGVTSLCLARRVDNLDVTGIELQPGLCELARENARRNGFQERWRVIEGNIVAQGKTWSALGLRQDYYDHVYANPPYFEEGKVRCARDYARARAVAHDGAALERWIRFMVAMTRAKGSVTLIHQAQALSALLQLLNARVGAIMILPLYSKRGIPANRVIVQGVKGSRAPLKLLQGVVLHKEDGSYTPEAEAVLRDGAALDLKSTSVVTP